jgi:hypothetical protein
VVLEYITITKDPRTELVVAIGGDRARRTSSSERAGSSTPPAPAGTITVFPTA